MKNKIYLQNTDTYISRIKELAKKPSLSKQIKIYIEYCKESEKEYQKRAASAYEECEKEKLFTFDTIVKIVENRYESFEDGTKYVSTWYMAQAIDKCIRQSLNNPKCSENTKKCISKYLRASILEGKTKKDATLVVKYNSAEKE